MLQEGPHFSPQEEAFTPTTIEPSPGLYDLATVAQWTNSNPEVLKTVLETHNNFTLHTDEVGRLLCSETGMQILEERVAPPGYADIATLSQRLLLPKTDTRDLLGFNGLLTKGKAYYDRRTSVPAMGLRRVIHFSPEQIAIVMPEGDGPEPLFNPKKDVILAQLSERVMQPIEVAENYIQLKNAAKYRRLPSTIDKSVVCVSTDFENEAIQKLPNLRPLDKAHAELINHRQLAAEIAAKHNVAVNPQGVFAKVCSLGGEPDLFLRGNEIVVPIGPELAEDIRRWYDKILEPNSLAKESRPILSDPPEPRPALKPKSAATSPVPAAPQSIQEIRPAAESTTTPAAHPAEAVQPPQMPATTHVTPPKRYRPKTQEELIEKAAENTIETVAKKDITAIPDPSKLLPGQYDLSTLVGIDNYPLALQTASPDVLHIARTISGAVKPYPKLANLTQVNLSPRILAAIINYAPGFGLTDSGTGYSEALEQKPRIGRDIDTGDIVISRRAFVILTGIFQQSEICDIYVHADWCILDGIVERLRGQSESSGPSPTKEAKPVKRLKDNLHKTVIKQYKDVDKHIQHIPYKYINLEPGQGTIEDRVFTFYSPSLTAQILQDITL